jgi:ceramide glucosyltransferase
MIYVIRLLQIISVLGCLTSSAYYLLCLWSVRSFLHEEQADRSVRPTQARPTQALPPISILKPLKGVDPDIYESFRSHCLQDYPEYEIVFGVSDADDPAIASVERLKKEFPGRAIRLVVAPKILGANVKVSNLQQMLPHARYEYLIVDDSDIRVERDYLRRVIAPFIAEEDHVGMVTCLYRGVAAPTLGSRLESLGISTDFCAGVLVARQLEGGLHFALGSTMAFRRADLALAGGFEAIVDHLADDYELGRRIANLGLHIHLSDVVVETHLPAYDLRGFFAHQLRWARGVRDSRAGGYFGLVTTFGLMWALLAFLTSGAAQWSIGLLLGVAALRVAVAIAIGKVVLKDSRLLAHLWLLPLRDLIAVGVWVASFAGHTVTWRGDRFYLKDGRLSRQ